MRPLFCSFLGDCSGSTALTLGLSMPMLALAVGGGIDLSRAAAKRQRIASAIELGCQHSALEVSYRRQQPNASQSETYRTVIDGIVDQKLDDAGVGDTSITSDLVDDFVTITATSDSTNVFGGIIGYETVPLSVKRRCKTLAAAPPPQKPSEISLALDFAYGTYWKKVSVWVRRPGASSDTEIGSIIYQPTDRSAYGGRGTGTVTGSINQTLKLGKYDQVYLKMEVATDGCPPDKYYNINTDRCINRGKLTKEGEQYTLRTNDPKTSKHLYVNGKQLPPNAPASSLQLFTCGKTVKHAWEDGGAWATQDIGFTVKASNCS